MIAYTPKWIVICWTHFYFQDSLSLVVISLGLAVPRFSYQATANTVNLLICTFITYSLFHCWASPLSLFLFFSNITQASLFLTTLQIFILYLATPPSHL